jgi:outer membrane protein assembly factor BamA
VPAAPVEVPCVAFRIGRVTVSGAPPDSVPQLRVLEGTMDDQARIERVADLALRDLRAQGYVDADLSIGRHAGCGVDIDVQVVLGRRYRIGSIVFAGAPDADPAAGIDRLAALEDGLGTVNTLGGVYIEYRMQRAVTELERRYRDAGWLEAKLGPPRASYDRTSGVIAVRIPTELGARFTIGSIKAVGANADARARLIQALGIRSGDYYNAPRLRTAIERARHQLERKVELRTNVIDRRLQIDVEAVVNDRTNDRASEGRP